MTSINSILDLVFPPICPLCREKWIVNDESNAIHQNYCLECMQKLICQFDNFCPKCGLPVGSGVNAPDCKTCRGRAIHYDQLLFVNEYKTYVGELIVNFKYRKDKILAHFLSMMIYDKIKMTYAEIDAIIPVPMYWVKKIKRGFNQSEMIAFELSQQFKIPLATNILKRSIKGKNQAGQSRTIRYKGAKGLYSFKKKTAFKKVLLVDDVVTTGSTLSECAKILKEAGVEKVYCAAIAGVHRDK